MTLLVAILALLLAAPVPCPYPHRSKGAVAKFRRANPCPGGPDKGSKVRCRGYVVDHICALECCGLDAPQNMQYQDIKAGKAKDRLERNCAKYCTARRPVP